MAGADASIEGQLAEQESRALASDEKEFYDAAIESLDKEDRELFLQQPLDILQIVRGCAGEANRKEATIKTIKFISDWRKKVGYYQNFEKNLEHEEEFHRMWPEYVCGTDKYGHFIQVLPLSFCPTFKLTFPFRVFELQRSIPTG